MPVTCLVPDLYLCKSWADRRQTPADKCIENSLRCYGRGRPCHKVSGNIRRCRDNRRRKRHRCTPRDIRIGVRPGSLCTGIRDRRRSEGYTRSHPRTVTQICWCIYFYNHFVPTPVLLGNGIIILLVFFNYLVLMLNNKFNILQKLTKKLTLQLTPLSATISVYFMTNYDKFFFFF